MSHGGASAIPASANAKPPNRRATTSEEAEPLVDVYGAAPGGLVGGDWVPAAGNAVRAWGANLDGQLGDGTDDQREAPVFVRTQLDCTVLAAGCGRRRRGGDFSLAADVDGAVWAWGSNRYGALGDSTLESRPVPARVEGLPLIIAVAAGTWHSLALDMDGTAWAWGGEDGVPRRGSRPHRVEGLDSIRQIAAGDGYSLALREDGSVWTWGIEQPEPAAIPGLPAVRFVAAGPAHWLAIAEDGTVWTRVDEGVVRVEGLDDVVQVAAGADHSLALGANGMVWVWEGSPGDGRPAPVEGLSEVAAIAAGDGYSLALLRDGTVRAWGDDREGQLGDGRERAPRGSIVQVAGLEGIRLIAAGRAHALAR